MSVRLAAMGALILVALAGCSGGARNRSSFAGLPASPSAHPSQALTDPSPAPSSSPASQPPAGGCRLPVATGATTPPIGPARADPNAGAFIRYPDGTIEPDPTGAPRWSERDPSAVDLNGLHGYGGPSYSRSAQRWLPAPWSLVAPDGFAYTYAEAAILPVGVSTPYRVRVVNVRTGEDRVLLPENRLFPVEYAAEGIYLRQGAWEGTPVGLWRLDPSSGSLLQVSGRGAWYVIGPGAAWGTDTGTASVGMGTLISRIDRLDLASGRIEKWYERPGLGVYPVGIDAQGRPLVYVYDRSVQAYSELVVLTAPGQAIRLVAGPFRQVLSDPRGTWLIGNSSVSVLGADSGLREIYQWTYGQPGLQVVSLAGTCR